jgi:hypothetical protein
MDQILPLPDAPSQGSVLDQLDGVGAAGEELGYQNPEFDRLTSEFNRAVRECDLKAFLIARERYIAELRRILSNPHLEARARSYFEGVLKAVLETRTPIKAPCPVFIR